MKRILIWVCSFFLALPASARLTPQVCGTSRETAREALHLHRVSTARRLTLAHPRPAASPAVRAAGHIAVMEDGDGVVAFPNLFNLDKTTLTLQREASGAYRFATGPAGYDAALAAAGDPLSGLGDDDARKLALPFAFPFYGATWREVWVHSDGNLTFGEPDAASSSRSLGRLTSGPPRIAPLFNDLDPSRSGSVRLLAEAGRVVVSWVDVPEYADSGAGANQRFQVRLYPDGRIEFAWDGVSLKDGVVGIAPGLLRGTTAVVSFHNDSSAAYTGAVAERFGITNSIDMVRAAQKFYEVFDDAYDYLVVYNRSGIPAQAGAVAYELTVRSSTQGIGEEIFDHGAAYGSPARLRAVLNMGATNQYPSNPYAIVPGRGNVTGDTPMSILGHETGHQWLALVSVPDSDNPDIKPMLGAQNAHWSFNFNSEASLLEGNRIRDDGPLARPRFFTTATVQGYAPLDQYLMGFRAPAEVPPTFLVNGSAYANASLPRVGATLAGTRQDVSIDNVIAAAGRRVPDETVAQRRFRFAFIVITPAGQEMPAAELSVVDAWRREFETYFNTAAGGRAFADTRLTRASQLSLSPSSGVLAGRTVEARLDIASAAAADLTYRMDGAAPWLETPATITVPRGQASVSFNLVGGAAGVADLSATPSSDLYEAAHARIQVRASAAELHLEPIAGANSVLTPGIANGIAVAVRAVDGNNLPYPGLGVRGEGDGSITPARATTDAKGIARFQWTTSTAPDRLFTARLELQPSVAAEIAVLSPPNFESSSVVNAASFEAGVTPGGLASIFGFNLWSGTAQGPLPVWPTVLDSVRVLVDGTPAQILVTSLRQINFLVPATARPSSARITVENAFGASAAVTVPVLSVQPALFYDAASGRAAARQVGRYFELYGTGLAFATQVDAEVDGLPARVDYFGPTAGIPGLHQVNIELPAAVGPGEHVVVLKSAGRASNSAKLLVQ